MKSSTRRVVGQRHLMSLAALALAVSPLANAQEPYWYGGVNAGHTSATLDNSMLVNSVQNFGYATTYLAEDDHDFGYKLLSGYRFNDMFAIEGSFFDLGKFGFREVLVPDANLAGNIRPMGFGLDLVGFVPLSEASSLFARAGINYTEVRESFSARNLPSQPFPKSQNNDTNYKYGVGFQHEFTDNLTMRVEAERYRLDETIGLIDSADMYSVGVLYRFGGKKAAPVPVAAAPIAAPVRAAPTPAPAPAPAPTPAPPVRITLSADSLFDFDSATIRPAGKVELDKLASDLRPLHYDFITVTGHTDRIGSEKYNHDLSLRRAEAVKRYLVSSAGIMAARINTRGVDGSDPVTTASQCANLGKAALISCLQPDRRVEVEVVGTK